MKNFLFSCLLAWLPNVFTGWVDQTPKTIIRGATESLTINCVLRDPSYAFYSTYWYLTKLGATNKESMSIGGRYAETVNKGSNSFSLRITDLRVEDSGTYQCGACDGYVTCNTWSEGSGTILTVKPDGAQPSPPVISLLYSATEEQRVNGFLQLVCVISGYYPETIAVTWQKNGNAISSGFTTTPPMTTTTADFSSTSWLKVPMQEWSSGSIYSCHVSHSETNSNLRKEISSASDDCHQTDISVNLLKPSFEEIWTQKTATIVCEIVYNNFGSINVFWQVNGAEITKGVETENPNWNGSKFTIVSKLKIMASEWDSGAKYVCLVENSELSTPVEASIKKTIDSEMHPPQVYLLHPSTDEIDTEDSATLMCVATSFYPAEIYIGWMANDTLLDTGYRTHVDSEKGNGSNFMTSRLTVTAAEWNSDTTYTCLVGHPSLSRELIRSTNKSHGKPTSVNVSVVLSDIVKSCT